MCQEYEIIANKATIYALKSYNLLGMGKDWLREDVFQEARLSAYETGDFNIAKNAAASFIYRQVKMKGMVGGTGNFLIPVPVDNSYDRLPVIALARLLRTLLKSTNRRRNRHSAAIKALVLADRADNISFAVIANKYHISLDNAKGHYRMAWILLRHWFACKVDTLDEEQRELFRRCFEHVRRGKRRRI